MWTGGGGGGRGRGGGALRRLRGGDTGGGEDVAKKKKENLAGTGLDGKEREREEKMSHDECEKLRFDDDVTSPREDLKQGDEHEQRARASEQRNYKGDRAQIRCYRISAILKGFIIRHRIRASVVGHEREGLHGRGRREGQQ